MPEEKITIIVPTYNEAENLPELVSALMLLGQPALDVLVVDDNSPDGTGAIAEDLTRKHPGKVRVLHRQEKAGLGRAYLHGYEVALENGATVIGQMDADFSHPPEKILEMIPVLDHYDIAIGSRYVPGGSLDQNWPIWRKGLSAFGNYYARTILGLPARDVTGGFRLFNGQVLKGMPRERVRSNGYVFQVEMAYLAHLCGFRFKEIPIYFADRKWGQSKMSLRIQIEAAMRVWQVKNAYRDLSQD